MPKKKTTIEVIPSARKLIQSLRDVGYDLNDAVADLVDNSIAANATSVEIEMTFDGEASWIRIADNGGGMSGTAITEAMRFGSEREYDNDELGKFGLGLKTASLSQSSLLTVASRSSSKSHRIEARQWDLAHVLSSNRWEVIDLAPENRSQILTEPLEISQGTVVLWEQLDRVLGYKIPWGEHAKNNFLRLAGDLDQHLGMVFHRFLSGEAKRKRKLTISINGTRVEPWDPFAREERHTTELPREQFEIAGDNGKGLVAYSPYILPPKDRFSSLQAFNRYAGPRKWNYQQGFYIYRADRMIQSGGWSYMRTSDEHTKLARVALDFWPDLDSAFELNVAKARVKLSTDLRTKLGSKVEQLAKKAREVYASAGHTPDAGGGYVAEADKSAKSIHRSFPSRSPYESTNAEPHIGKAIQDAAVKAHALRALAKIQEILRTENPGVAAKIGW